MAMCGTENLLGRRCSSERDEEHPEGSVTLRVMSVTVAAVLRTEGREQGAEVGTPVKRLPQ